MPLCALIWPTSEEFTEPFLLMSPDQHAKHKKDEAEMAKAFAITEPFIVKISEGQRAEASFAAYVPANLAALRRCGPARSFDILLKARKVHVQGAKDSSRRALNTFFQLQALTEYDREEMEPARGC